MDDEAAQPAPPLDTWVDLGRALAASRLDLDWQIASWMAQGKRAGHLGRVKFSYLAETLSLAPKRLKDALKAATAFPPELRVATVSVDHHATVAGLPQDEALALLNRAASERSPVQLMREAVAQYRLATGERFADEDTDSTLATLQIRAWNRATPEARAIAYEHFRIAAAKGLSIIDEDEAPDAR